MNIDKAVETSILPAQPIPPSQQQHQKDEEGQKKVMADEELAFGCNVQYALPSLRVDRATMLARAIRSPSSSKYPSSSTSSSFSRSHPRPRTGQLFNSSAELVECQVRLQDHREGIVLSSNPINGWITIRTSGGQQLNVRAGFVEEILQRPNGTGGTSTGSSAAESKHAIPVDGEALVHGTDSSLMGTESYGGTVATDTFAIESDIDSSDTSSGESLNKQPRGRAPKDHVWNASKDMRVHEMTGFVRASLDKRKAENEVKPAQKRARLPCAAFNPPSEDTVGGEAIVATGAAIVETATVRAVQNMEETPMVDEKELEYDDVTDIPAIGIDLGEASIDGKRARRAATVHVDYNESDARFWDKMGEKMSDLEMDYDDDYFDPGYSFDGPPLAHAVKYVRPEGLPPPQIPTPPMTNATSIEESDGSTMDTKKMSEEVPQQPQDITGNALGISSFRESHQREQYSEPKIGERVLKFFVGFGRYQGTIISYRDAQRQDANPESGRDHTLATTSNLYSKAEWGTEAKQGDTIRYYRVEFDDGDVEEYELKDAKALIRFHQNPQQLENLIYGGMSYEALSRGSGSSRGARASALDAIPVDERLRNKATKIILLQDNPKKQKTKSWARYDTNFEFLIIREFYLFLLSISYTFRCKIRYERYKIAKTVSEYLEFGGLKADVKFDFQRGYLAWIRDDGKEMWASSANEETPTSLESTNPLVLPPEVSTSSSPSLMQHEGQLSSSTLDKTKLYDVPSKSEPSLLNDGSFMRMAIDIDDASASAGISAATDSNNAAGDLSAVGKTLTI